MVYRASPATPFNLPNVSSWRAETDVLIVGGGGTPTQTACGFDDDIEEMHKYLLLAAGPNADPQKVRLYCDRTLEHYHWLTQQGVVFKPQYYPHKHTSTPSEAALMISGYEEAWHYNAQAKPAPPGHKPQIKGDHGGIPLMKNLLRRAWHLAIIPMATPMILAAAYLLA